VLHSVIGWDCTIGQWTRVEGIPNYNLADKTAGGITIFGAPRPRVCHVVPLAELKCCPVGVHRA
jgi:hypothetical protein